MPKVIDSFTGKYAFLSNFFNCPVTYNHTTYRNAEAAFQAQKCPKRAGEFTNLTPSQAKRLGRKVQLSDDWEDRKLIVMKNVVGFKFGQNPHLLKKLLDTGDAVLIEGNDWGDTFWGVTENDGENHLGIILMQTREVFRKV